MKTQADENIQALEQLLKDQNTELAHLLEKVNHLEEMVARGVPQAHPSLVVKSVPRRWYPLNPPSSQNV